MPDDQTPELKICTKCKTPKPPTEDFFARQTGKSVLKGFCKACTNEQARERRGKKVKPTPTCVICGVEKEKKEFRRTARFPLGDVCVGCRELPLPGEVGNKCRGCGILKHEGAFAMLPTGSRRKLCLKCEQSRAPGAARRHSEAQEVSALLSRDGEIVEGPWDRLRSGGEGCQRFKYGETYAEGDDLAECGQTPCRGIEISSHDGSQKTYLRLCSECELETSAVWVVKQVGEPTKCSL
jgi:hypothetical protein